LVTRRNSRSTAAPSWSRDTSRASNVHVTAAADEPNRLRRRLHSFPRRSARGLPAATPPAVGRHAARDLKEPGLLAAARLVGRGGPHDVQEYFLCQALGHVGPTGRRQQEAPDQG
jgi:hypothetical protein